MIVNQPTWYTEAIEREIDYVVLVYGKAEGFVFCPSNLEKPFRVGGDYDGNMPTTAEGAIEHYTRWLNQAYIEDVSWFMKFVRKVSANEDFSLNDIEIEERKLLTISGKWPW